MYRKILLAYDGTSHSDVALRQAADLAKLSQAELHLLGIVSITRFPAIAGELAAVDIWTAERSQLETALESAVKDLGREGLTPASSIREGTPVNEIVDCAHEISADLVVLGHSDKGVFERWFEGSVGAGLLRNLPCSVLIAAQAE